MVRTRFAPSPSGYLHIGGARTALFAWAWARKHNGEFLLRIEDTDAVRSEESYSDAIIQALEWLQITPDAPPVFQSSHRARHQQIIRDLVDAGKAYYCYASAEELDAMRAEQQARGETPRYDRRWRDSDKPPPSGVAPSVRFKMPLTGETVFADATKGRLTVANDTLDDFVIARSDGMPTYHLAAVNDDIEMGITHVIRGDDHVMNTFRQWHLFCALTPTPPVFAHLPMILAPVTDADGKPELGDDNTPRYARMSKRHAAADVNRYREEGFLPAAVCNYLARLSWAHGDSEIFARDFFLRHFELSAVRQSPARFDWEKLCWLNREYLRQMPAAELRRMANVTDAVNDAALALISDRAVTLRDIKNEAAVFETAPVADAALMAQHLTDNNRDAFRQFSAALADLPAWAAADIKSLIKTTAADAGLSFKHIAMPLRVLLTGKSDSPDIAAIAAALGQDEVLRRLAAGGIKESGKGRSG